MNLLSAYASSSKTQRLGKKETWKRHFGRSVVWQKVQSGIRDAKSVLNDPRLQWQALGGDAAKVCAWTDQGRMCLWRHVQRLSAECRDSQEKKIVVPECIWSSLCFWFYAESRSPARLELWSQCKLIFIRCESHILYTPLFFGSLSEHMYGLLSTNSGVKELGTIVCSITAGYSRRRTRPRKALITTFLQHRGCAPLYGAQKGKVSVSSPLHSIFLLSSCRRFKGKLYRKIHDRRSSSCRTHVCFDVRDAVSDSDQASSS
nr:hypothetical protein CFP56_62187 [Quercus suber]